MPDSTYSRRSDEKSCKMHAPVYEPVATSLLLKLCAVYVRKGIPSGSSVYRRILETVAEFSRDNTAIELLECDSSRLCSSVPPIGPYIAEL